MTSSDSSTGSTSTTGTSTTGSASTGSGAGTGNQGDGRGTKGGGGENGPDAAVAHAIGTSGSSGAVANQQLLVLDNSTLTELPKAHRKRVRLAQLRFARDVSHAAVAAYDSILQILSEDLGNNTHQVR